jgi:hypothetical protein
MAYFYMIAGMMLIIYPLTLLYRVMGWEINRRSEEKHLIHGYVIILIAILGYALGIIMLVMGSEMLKGNIIFLI